MCLKWSIFVVCHDSQLGFQSEDSSWMRNCILRVHKKHVKFLAPILLLWFFNAKDAGAIKQPRRSMLTIELEWLTKSEHVVQALLKTCLLGVAS
jgi:hypothetical protein